MIIDCVSDLHGHYPELEGGDLLIVAGDCTARDDDSGWCSFETWLMNQKYKKKIIVAGNHDNFLQSMDEHRMWRYWEKIPNVTYLCDSGTEFVYYTPIEKNMPDGTIIERHKFRIWGSPWSKTFPRMNPHCKAFTVDTEEELAEKWALIPDDTDILVTHSPPWGMLDDIKPIGNGHWEHVGSKSLLSKWMDLDATAHIFGHVHESYGIIEDDGFYYVNASHVNENYLPVHKPIRIEL